MRRINIYIDEELDRRTEREARRRHLSKAALIRQCLHNELDHDRGQEKDPIDALVGMSNADPPGDPRDIDAVIYGA